MWCYVIGLNSTFTSSLDLHFKSCKHEKSFSIIPFNYKSTMKSWRKYWLHLGIIFPIIRWISIFLILESILNQNIFSRKYRYRISFIQKYEKYTVLTQYKCQGYKVHKLHRKYQHLKLFYCLFSLNNSFLSRW